MSWAEEQDWFGLEDLAIEAEQKAERAEKLIKLGYWVQSDRKEVHLHAMTDSHLQNCINMINEGRLNRKWALSYLIREQKRRIALNYGKRQR